MTDLTKHNMKLVAGITAFHGTVPRGAVPVDLSYFEQSTNVELEASRWQISKTWKPVASNAEGLELSVRFVVEQGSLPAANVSVDLVFQDWSTDHYVMLPAAAYNGNRFVSHPIPYPPSLAEEHGIGLDMPITITDVPRLAIGEGRSVMHFRMGDLATPAACVFDPHKQSGVIVLAEPRTVVGESGIAVEENGDRSRAVVSVSSPAVRRQTKYVPNDNQAPSDDVPCDFGEGDEVNIKLRLFLFDCPDIASLFTYFAGIRKALSGSTKLHHELPFSEAMAILATKYNRENWESVEGYYKVGTGDSPYDYWQAGWIGGGINSYPLLALGDEQSRHRALQTLRFIFGKLQAPSGFFYTVAKNGVLMGDDFNTPERENLILLRKHADMLYFLIKHLLLLEKTGRAHEVEALWKEGIVRGCDALMRIWNKYGQFGQFIDLERDEIVVGSTASAGAAPAALALAGEYLKRDVYIRIAEQAGDYYYRHFIAQGITNGGPAEIAQCPDSESAFALLESYVVLYEVTGDQAWIRMAEQTAAQCVTWCVSYDYEFPPQSEFGRLQLLTAGSVYANVQNKHSSPGICTFSGDSLFKLYRATGNPMYLEWIRETAHNVTQYLSREDRPVRDWSEDKQELPAGYMCERVNMSDWESKDKIGGVFYGSCWCEVSAMLTYAELPGVYLDLDTAKVTVFDHVEVEVQVDYEGSITLIVTNPTRFEANVRVLCETGSQRKRTLGQHALLGCKELRIGPQSSVEWTCETS